MLFEDLADSNLKSCIKMVEAVLTELGHEPVSSRIAPPSKGAVAGWSVRAGSANVVIVLVRDDIETSVRVSSTVVTLPESEENAEALIRRALELNAQTIRRAAFGLSGDSLVLRAERATTDLDKSEVLDLIKRVEKYADHYDDEFIDSFQAGRPG